MSELEPLPAVRASRWWESRSSWAASLLALGALVGSWGYARRPAPVDVVLARKGPLEQRLVTTGRVLPPARIGLGSTVLGRVTEVRIEDGTRVERGELLVRLDDAVAQAEVAQARAALNAALARVGRVARVSNRVAERVVDERVAAFERAEREWQRAKRLEAEGAITEAELDELRTRFEIARSQLATARAEVESTAPGGGEHSAVTATATEARAALAVAEARLAATRIEAPSPGVVLARRVEPGDVVQPGSPLVELLGAGETRLMAQVDEKYLGLIALEQRATAIADARPERPFSTELVWIAPAVDPGRGTIELRFAVREPPTFARPEMTVSINLELARRDAALMLPLHAIRDATGESPWAMVVVDERLERRPLRLGIRGDEWVEILAGVSEGEPVAVGPQAVPAIGARVRPRVVEPRDG